MPPKSKFSPKFTITPKIANCLMHNEAAKQAVQDLPITPSVLATLRETARLFSTHYSTMIEGNRLTQEQVSKVIEDKQHFPGRERDANEVLGYYAALEKLEQLTASQSAVTETHIQTLHALVMAEGRKKIKPTPYRAKRHP
jgi:Fic family protein